MKQRPENFVAAAVVEMTYLCRSQKHRLHGILGSAVVAQNVLDLSVVLRAWPADPHSTLRFKDREKSSHQPAGTCVHLESLLSLLNCDGQAIGDDEKPVLLAHASPPQ